MQIEIVNTLNGAKKQQAEILIQRCQEFDNLHDIPYLDNNFNYYPQMPMFILGWSKVEKQLIGIVSLYAGNDYDVNLTWFVDPRFRQQGYGQQLLLCAKELCREYKFAEIVAQLEGNQIVKQQQVLENLKFKPLPEVTEVLMKLDLSKQELSLNNNFLTVRLAQESDLKSLAFIHMNGFEDDFKHVYRDLVATMKNKALQLYVFYVNERLLGSVTVEVTVTKQGYLFGYVIKKELRGKGYGQIALKMTLKYLQQQGLKVLKLAVEKENNIARHIYSKQGFQIVTTLEYLAAKI